MGLSDIAPTTCLKRCRSEESFSVSGPPPSKQPSIPSAHHRSILQDLENSLDFPPNTEAVAAPEALVTEMMQSLEKVMGDIAELMATSGGSQAPFSLLNSAPLALPSSENSLQAHYDSIPCNGSSGVETSPPPMSGNSCQQEAGTAQTDSLRVWTSRSCDSAEPGASSMAANSAASLCADAGIADGHWPELISTVFEYGAELANYEAEIELREAHSRLDVGFLHLQVTNENTSEQACSVTDDCCSQGSVSSLNNSEQKAPSERNDGGWCLLDEFAEDLSSAPLQLNSNVWLEDVSDIPAFTFLPQAEEETWLLNARDNSEMLGFDCSL